jgi:alkanesulfonate monooxygenase SsuD/methylene tetrahydromethanopterin reductase-like flavin-dependent oxidoreductase (luciferase family)
VASSVVSDMTSPAATDLGFLTFVPNCGGRDTAAQALHNGVELFRAAEAFGYDSGWVRMRHFEQILSSPLTFLAAVSQVTSTIKLGTGIIPIRYKEPIQLAEAAATVDLLSNNRLELGLGSGIASMRKILDPVFGATDRSFSDESQRRVTRLREMLAGAPAANSGEGTLSIPADTDLYVTPASPTLIDRLWYGPGASTGAFRSGEQGLDILLSTLNGEDTGDAFETTQLQQIAEYRRGFSSSARAATHTPRIAVGRFILPLVTSDDEAAYRPFIDEYETRIDDEGLPRNGGKNIRFGRLYYGTPAQIVDELSADPVLTEATTLLATLPELGSFETHERTLQVIAEQIAPDLGIRLATA